MNPSVLVLLLSSSYGNLDLFIGPRCLVLDLRTAHAEFESGIVLRVAAPHSFIHNLREELHFADSQTGREVGYLEGDYLYSSSTGQEIGYKSGRAIYSRDGSVLGYCDGGQP